MFPAWIWALHLMGAIWLSAGVFSSAVVNAQLKRTDGDLASRVLGLRIGWRLMVIFVVPGVILTGLFGFYLLYLFGMVREVSVQTVVTQPGWLKVSILLYFPLLGGILFVQVPGIRKALSAAEASRAAGAPTAELLAAQQAKLPAILTHVNATLIFLMIFLMAFKPF
jgi:uncharacterized membrane protein